MSFLKKLFGGSDDTRKATGAAAGIDNRKLIGLLDSHGKHPSEENYHAVFEEVTNGNSFLLLPSVNDGNTTTDVWDTLKEGDILKLTCVADKDGVKVLTAFSDEPALLKWTEGNPGYSILKAQDVIKFCMAQGISQILINSNQKNMFVLARDMDNISERPIDEDAEAMIGSPAEPLAPEVIERLIEHFRAVDVIEEAYQFSYSIGEETSLVLGIRLTEVTDETRAAMNKAINDSLNAYGIDGPVDIMLLDTEEWLVAVRNIEDSLFYER